ncbi:MAG: hypothetical protein IKS56_02800 [Lachnospiraceae bacterium]|nr:hypothetical protein [Lachnospiraceae bacterium]
MTKKKLIIIIIAVAAVVLAVYIPAVMIFFGSKTKDGFAYDNGTLYDDSESAAKEKSEDNKKSAEGLIVTYTCDKNNMCGFEEVDVYENRVDLIFDKKILDSSAEKYGGSFKNTVKGIYSTKAELIVLNAYPHVTGIPSATSDNTQYIVTVPYSYNKEDIRDPEEVVKAVKVALNDTFYIDFYDARIVITTQYEKNGNYEMLNQWYDEKECVWGDIKSVPLDHKLDDLL